MFLIGTELVDLRGLRRIYRERPWEFWVAVITGAVVVFVGVEQSILLAIVLSLIVHTRHGYLVNNMLLAPDEALGWRQRPVSTRAQATPGLMIYRFMHNIYYANCHVLSVEIMGLANHESGAPSWICIDASAVNDVDFTAAETLRTLHRDLDARGIKLVLCGVVDAVRLECDRSRLTDLVGRDDFFPTPGAVLAAYREGDPGSDPESRTS